MRDNIPKDILDRCEFRSTAQDSTEYLVRIKPLEDCPCGRELDNTRRVRLAKTVEPRPHWREYCITCKLVSVLDHNTWMPAKVLNDKLRTGKYSRDK
jgi:hypothetical protein